jgi:hypothetical protein
VKQSQQPQQQPSPHHRTKQSQPVITRPETSGDSTNAVDENGQELKMDVEWDFEK